MRSFIFILALYGALGVHSSPLANHEPGQLDTHELEVISLFENAKTKRRDPEANPEPGHVDAKPILEVPISSPLC